MLVLVQVCGLLVTNGESTDTAAGAVAVANSHGRSGFSGFSMQQQRQR